MQTNRRNLLIGIGTAAVGSGAVIGSGALTQVEATRTMDVQAVGDGSAYLQLSPDATSFVNTSGSGNNGQAILSIDLTQLNDDAVTTISPAFTATNGLSEGVGVRIRSDAYGTSEPAGLTIESNTNNQNLADYPTQSTDDHNLDAGGSVQVDIIIDTSQLDTSTVSSIDIEADTSQYN